MTNHFHVWAPRQVGRSTTLIQQMGTHLAVPRLPITGRAGTGPGPRYYSAWTPAARGAAGLPSSGPGPRIGHWRRVQEQHLADPGRVGSEDSGPWRKLIRYAMTKYGKACLDTGVAWTLQV